MALTNTTHPIKPVTVVAAATPQNVATDLGLTDSLTSDPKLSPQCQWFAIQNKDAVNSIYVQESAAAAAADSIEVKAGDYYRANSLPTGSYDLREYWIRVAADGQKYVIERKVL